MLDCWSKLFFHFSILAKPEPPDTSPGVLYCFGFSFSFSLRYPFGHAPNFIKRFVFFFFSSALKFYFSVVPLFIFKYQMDMDCFSSFSRLGRIHLDLVWAQKSLIGIRLCLLDALLESKISIKGFDHL